MKNTVEADAVAGGMPREKQLRLIAKQLKVRGQATGKKLTFAAVAKAAGVSTALIHNHYPDVAEEIRRLQGKSSRAQRDAKREELAEERATSKSLRQDVRDLQLKVRSLASINETLIAENAALRARRPAGKVVDLDSRRPIKS